MPTIHSDGVCIYYDTFGDSSSPPLLLISGYGSQMILWDERFCEKLAKRSLYMIRFDNRDVGLSSKIENTFDYDFNEIAVAILKGQKVKIPYTLDDMAADAIGLMDSLHIKKAHVLGASMGGMIAQIMAIKYPDRLFSLISMLSTTGNPEISAGISTEKNFLLVALHVHPKRTGSEYRVYVKGNA